MMTQRRRIPVQFERKYTEYSNIRRKNISGGFDDSNFPRKYSSFSNVHLAFREGADALLKRMDEEVIIATIRNKYNSFNSECLQRERGRKGLNSNSRGGRIWAFADDLYRNQ